MLFILFFLPVGFLISRLNKKYKNLWLIGERGTDARDNGYWFYKYLKEEHKDINSWYVISKNSPDFEKISCLGNVVLYKSFKHYLMYFSAQYLVGTHVQPVAPDKIMYYHFAKKGIKPQGKQVFLQHGIILNDMSWLNKENFYINLFVCGGKKEYEHIKENYNHPDGIVQYLGLSRFDNLIKANKKENFILLMPTWRGASYPCGKEFLNTNYYKFFNSLINNEKLNDLLEKYNYNLIFYPHIEMQKYLNDFKTSSKRITVCGQETYDVQKLLMECSMLITDYSSVFFDVAYLKKPVLYYQFDEKEFYSYHYNKGYFNFGKDGFGPVFKDEKSLIFEIENCFLSGMNMVEKYEKRTEDFFELRDDKNSKRIFDAICNLS